MAVSKKSSTKSPAPKKKTTKKFSLDFSSWKKGFRKRWDKNPSIYTLGTVILLVVIFLALMFISNKSLFLAGTINGKFITTPQFYSELTKSSGEEAFESLIQETLIKQEAAKKGVSASEEEIDKKLKELEDQLGGKESFQRALEQNNTGLEQVKSQIVTQILVEKILEGELEVTSKEISDYKKANKDFIGEMTDKQIKEALKSQKLNERFTSWFENLKKDAKINTYF